MHFRLGPLAITISWSSVKPQPSLVDAKIAFASDLLDTAALLQPVALELQKFDLPDESRALIFVVLHPEHLLACQPADAIAAIRHVGYLAVECNLATFS